MQHLQLVGADKKPQNDLDSLFERQERFLRIQEVMHLTGLKRSSIYRAMDEDRFPESINLGTRNIAWLESEIRAWIANKIATRDHSTLENRPQTAKSSAMIA